MKNCLSCGAENVDDSNNCMQCGEKFDAVSSVNDTATADDVRSPEKTSSEPNVSETNFNTERPVEPVQQPLYGKQGEQPQNQPYTQGQPNAQGPYAGQQYGGQPNAQGPYAGQQYGGQPNAQGPYAGQPYGQQPYGAPVGGMEDIQKMLMIGKAKRKGTTALTMAIISVFFLWFPPIAIILAVLACINGIIAVVRLKKIGEAPGKAIAAVIVATLVVVGGTVASVKVVQMLQSDEFLQEFGQQFKQEFDKEFRDAIEKGMDGLDEEERERALKEFESNFGQDFRQYYEDGMVKEQMAKGYIDRTLLQK